MDAERRSVVLSRLSRRTSGGRWIPEVDGLRFLAIALVLASHATVALNIATKQAVVEAPFGSSSESSRHDVFFRMFGHGSTGVLLFFMVSGFVLALPFIRNSRAGGEPMPLWPYFRRRITRIEPPYLLVMTLLFAGSVLAGSPVALGRYVASLFYLYGTYYGSDSPLNSVAWSLEVEVQFYVVVPALALLLCAGRGSRRRLTIVLLAALASAVNAMGLVVSYTFLGSTIQFFLLGWLLADIYIGDWAEAPNSDRLWDVVGFAALLAVVIGLALVPEPLGQALAPWLIFGMGYAVFRSVALRRMLSNRWIATIGGMCYSIYLIHYPVFILMSRYLGPLGGLPSLVALLVACAVLIPIGLVVGTVFFVLVERPFMDPMWPERVRERLRDAVPTRSLPQTEAVVVIPESEVVDGLPVS